MTNLKRLIFLSYILTKLLGILSDRSPLQFLTEEIKRETEIEPSFPLSSSLNDDYPCDKNEAIKSFKHKTIETEIPHYPKNPYDNKSKAYLEKVKAALSDNTTVCALKYTDDTKQNYQIEHFPSREEAETQGYTVTHQGKCGACSNLQDLAIYLERDLTQPVRKCGMWNVITHSKVKKCLLKIGFSEQCAEVWTWNTLNTYHECFWTCIYSWIKNEPLNKPDGSLNDCIQCDEDISGPIFKYESGRTRRNSGIRSEIDRPGDQVYNITHCYYK